MEFTREHSLWQSRQLFTDKSSEYIPLDQPGFVVDAIREMYSQSK